MATAASSATILVVDDDVGLLRLIQRTLEREGFRVAPVSSGQQVIAWLRENRADLMLLDLKLQDIEGRELVSQLSSTGCAPPFIIITGQGDERVAVDMMKRGALDYLVKDVKFIEFVPTVVRRALTRIEEQKRLAAAELTLREKEAQLALITDITPVALTQCSSDRRFVFVNRAYAQMIRRAPEEIIGKPIVEVIGEKAYAVILPYVEKVLRGETVDYEEELQFKEADSHFLSVIYRPHRNGAGEVTGWVASMTDITGRKRLERELVDISEREQRKFGHDLHDGLGQRLTGLEMMSYGLCDDLKSGAPALARQAQRLNRELRETVTQARLISHSLAPVPLAGEGLMQGLMQLAASTSRIPKVTCRFLCDPPVSIHDVAAATHLYRIAQEAVNNALKHGRARRIQITLAEGDEGVTLAIENNGCALPAANPGNSGMGLNVMRYRAGTIGATLSIESIKPKGVRVTCTLLKTT